MELHIDYKEQTVFTDDLMAVVKESIDTLNDSLGKDMTVILPYANALNKAIAGMLNRQCHAKVLEYRILPITTEEVWDAVTEANSYFMEYHCNHDLDAELIKLKSILETMDTESLGYLNWSLVIETEMRNVLDMTFKASSSLKDMHVSEINDRNVILIDDKSEAMEEVRGFLIRVQSATNARTILKECYLPKSITTIKLF